MSKIHNTKGQSSEGKSRIKRGVIASSVLAICFAFAGAIAPAHACKTQAQCTGFYSPNVTAGSQQNGGSNSNTQQTPRYGANNTQSSGGQIGVQYGGRFGPLSGRNLRLRLQFEDLAPQRNGNANQINQRQNLRGANLQWSQTLANFNPNVNQSRQVIPVRVRGYGPTGLNQIPLLNSHRNGSKANYRRDLMVNVTPRIVRER